ncbi:MAG: hypothetical protein IAF02_17965 [Anaerolineae bacterium]|nr:hypothetical protein [Anaerolineae bacterium]
MKRLLGAILFVVGIIGVVLAFVGIYFGLGAIDQIGSGLNSGIELALDSLATIQDTVTLTKTAVDEAYNSIQTVEKTAADMSTTIGDTGPLVDQMSVVIAQEIPNSVDAIQASLIPAAEVAKQMDNTLLALSAFSLDQSFLGFDLQFDLGIDYQPEEPLDESLLAIGSSLDGVADELRNLEPLMATNSSNVSLMSDNVALIAEDIASINTVIADINPLLDQYGATFTQLENALVRVQTDLDNYLQIAKIVLIVLMLWLAVMQTTAVVLGYEMVTGQLDKELVVYVHEGEDSKYARDNKESAKEEKQDEEDEQE